MNLLDPSRRGVLGALLLGPVRAHRDPLRPGAQRARPKRRTASTSFSGIPLHVRGDGRGGDHPVEGVLPSRLDEPGSRLASGCNTSIA